MIFHYDFQHYAILSVIIQGLDIDWLPYFKNFLPSVVGRHCNAIKLIFTCLMCITQMEKYPFYRFSNYYFKVKWSINRAADSRTNCSIINNCVWHERSGHYSVIHTWSNAVWHQFGHQLERLLNQKQLDGLWLSHHRIRNNEDPQLKHHLLFCLNFLRTCAHLPGELLLDLMLHLSSVYKFWSSPRATFRVLILVQKEGRVNTIIIACQLLQKVICRFQQFMLLHF